MVKYVYTTKLLKAIWRLQPLEFRLRNRKCLIFIKYHTHKHASVVHRVVDFEINESDARMRPLCAISQNTWTRLTAHTHAHQDKLYQLYLTTTVIGFKRIDWKHLHKTQQPIQPGKKHTNQIMWTKEMKGRVLV